MRARLLLWFSLAINALLAGMIVLLSRDSMRQFSDANIVVQGRAGDAPRLYKTNVVVRRQPFMWNEIESTNYPTYIANLRRIGCPQKTIRDIIVADVNDLFAERIAHEIVIPEQKWWLPDPDMDALEAGMNQVHALEAEKNQMLTELLGPDWNVPPRPNNPGNALHFDGPVLSKLSPEVKSTVEQIEANAQRSRAEILERARQQQEQADPVELSRLQQETRRQLASVLTPDQLEEYLLRYSRTAETMREQLRGYGADVDEFRRIFRARDAYEQQIAALTGNDPGTLQRRNELTRQEDEAVRQALGPERFSLYQLTENPLFRQAQEEAQQNGAPADKVIPIFRINQAVLNEMARIQNDHSLSEDQRKTALAMVQQQQRNSIDRIIANAPAVEMPPMPEVIAVPVGPPPPPALLPANYPMLAPLPPAPIPGP
jgi:hypothetical protein